MLEIDFCYQSCKVRNLDVQYLVRAEECTFILCCVIKKCKSPLFFTFHVCIGNLKMNTSLAKYER